MNRVEIIANNALEEDLLGFLVKKGIGKYYTRFNNVHGRGFSNPKMRYQTKQLAKLIPL